jgi:hypothetical protein
VTDRSMRTTGLVALALSLVVLLNCWGLVARGRRAIAAAEARQEARRAILDAVQDRLEREIAEFKAELDRMLEAERERARRARGETWRGRID